MPNPRLATRYAKSLIDLAIEKGQLEKIFADMQWLQAVCKGNRDFVNVLRSPVIKADVLFGHGCFPPIGLPVPAQRDAGERESRQVCIARWSRIGPRATHTTRCVVPHNAQTEPPVGSAPVLG